MSSLAKYTITKQHEAFEVFEITEGVYKGVKWVFHPRVELKEDTEGPRFKFGYDLMSDSAPITKTSELVKTLGRIMLDVLEKNQGAYDISSS